PRVEHPQQARRARPHPGSAEGLRAAAGLTDRLIRAGAAHRPFVSARCLPRGQRFLTRPAAARRAFAGSTRRCLVNAARSPCPSSVFATAPGQASRPSGWSWPGARRAGLPWEVARVTVQGAASPWTGRRPVAQAVPRGRALLREDRAASAGLPACQRGVGCVGNRGPTLAPVAFLTRRAREVLDR